MKILTIFGTRPEIIRLSLVMNKLDKVTTHVMVHTGQNYDKNLNEIFFDQMRIRKPDYYLGISGSIGEQTSMIFSKIEPVFVKEKPDKVLILGDTNSALAAFIAKRMGIPVYHMEAGNRCFDDRVPEEINRRVIDHSSDVLMPYTERSRQNLLAEGFQSKRIFVIGNPIYEVLESFKSKIDGSNIHTLLGLEKGKYLLVTMHRAENVDVQERLASLCQAFDQLQKQYGLPVIISTHPHTKSKLEKQGIINTNTMVRYLEPFGLFDFVALEKNARLVLSDSGTVQEECCIYDIPNVTLRDVTERPETVECGSNILSGAKCDSILNCASVALSHIPNWVPPHEYLQKNVSDTVVNITTGYKY